MRSVESLLVDQLHATLKTDPYVARRQLRFEADGGRVTLHGVVETYFQKQMAQEALRRVDGVDEIDNRIEVCWGDPQPLLL